MHNGWTVAVCMCLKYRLQIIEQTICTMVWLSANYLNMARHMKRGDQTCEMNLCVLFCGIHERIICGCK